MEVGTLIGNGNHAAVVVNRVEKEMVGEGVRG